MVGAVKGKELRVIVRTPQIYVLEQELMKELLKRIG